MEQKFDFVEVTLEPEDYDKVKEVYRLHKEQASKLFDLSSNIVTDEDIMDYIKVRVTYDIVLLAIDKETNHYSGCVILQDPIVYDDRIVNMECHLVVGKRYWGKNSRDIVNSIYEFIDDNETLLEVASSKGFEVRLMDREGKLKNSKFKIINNLSSIL